MIGLFCLLISAGPLALMVTTLIVQVKCFEEIINIGYAVYRIHGLPWFRSLSWYFLITSNYFFYGESLVDYFGVVINRTVSNRIHVFIIFTPHIKYDYLRVLITYHRFISFCLYIVGFVWFVLSLVKKYYMKQFSLFAWTHVALLIVVTQSYLIIQNIFEGLIWWRYHKEGDVFLKRIVAIDETWTQAYEPELKLQSNEWHHKGSRPKKVRYEPSRVKVMLIVAYDSEDQQIYHQKFIVPVSMIVCNDVMAYVFGFFFGRTPLIQLSPKKTWEGFIGGGIATVIFGLLMSYGMCQYHYFVCPIEYSETLGRMTMDCEPSPLFRPQEYTLPEFLSGGLQLVSDSLKRWL
ncbi:hypothetical protein ANN_20533 [Periplaneta americana]|uniref:phosphatidate cytidylyltransferase n=1 Tax=Periplaneta americana TaxID=6978 RepID=A0ABQ8SDN3_PERAM|nr:hypothetical protein ANN_20533 [Periplaneta americana]